MSARFMIEKELPAIAGAHKMDRVETTKARVVERIEALNLSRNGASRKAGLSLSYVNDLLAGKLKNPSGEALAKLAVVLQCDPGYLRGDQDELMLEPPTQVRRRGRPRSDEPIFAPTGLKLPLYQVGLTDADGCFRLDDKRRTMISATIGTPETYCVTVPDDTMAPRYRAGEVVIVNPSRPVSRGGFAVIRRADGRAMIREIGSIAPDRITVCTLDGQPAVDVPREEVQALERIIAATEL